MLLGERKPRGRSRRPEVFERDYGVCKDCRLDCEALRQAYLAAVIADNADGSYLCARCDTPALDPWQVQCHVCHWPSWRLVPATAARQSVEERLQAVGFTPKDCARLRASDGREPSLWESEHDVPVWEGGGQAKLEDLVTRCLPCHRVKSGYEAKRRGKLKTLRTRAAKRKARRKVRAGDVQMQKRP